MAETRHQENRIERVVATDSFRTAVSIAVSTICALPLFVPAALSQRIRDDLGLSVAEMGLIFGAHFLFSSMTSWPAGRLVERLGASLGMRLGLVIAAGSLVGCSLATSPTLLALSIAGSGIGQAIAQPAVNLYLIRRAGRHVLGRAFSLKQAAVPLATLVAGLAVPVATFVMGWRTLLLVMGGATALLMLLWTRRVGYGVNVSRGDGLVSDGARLSGRSLVLVTVTGAFGGAAATSLATFFVGSAVIIGISEPVSGVWLALASVLGIVARIVLGFVVDSRPGLDHMRLTAVLLALGSVGFCFLAVGLPRASFFGLMLCYVLGWSWPGLLHLFVATHNSLSPARATGGLLAGVGLGSGIGPLLFGQLVEMASYRVAWLGAALFSILAATAARTASRENRDSR